MNEQLWIAVDDYLESRLVARDPILDAALTDSRVAGLPDIQVSAIEGKNLSLLAEFVGARRILEIGTLGGYSAIWLARALPTDGRLISLEIDPHHADVARRNLDRAGVSDKVDIIVGPAVDSLAALHRQDVEPFDFFFIDADKENNPHYVEWALKLGRPGAAIVVDNVIRDGAIIDAESADPSVRGVRRLFDFVHNHPRLDAVAIQTVGRRGYDGFLVARMT